MFSFEKNTYIKIGITFFLTCFILMLIKFIFKILKLTKIIK